MTDIARVVTMNITRSTLGVAQRGFGVPLILSANAAFVERIRFYTDLDGVEVDFATTTPEWAMAAALFGQSVQPERIAIGRSANKPTQKYTITPVVANLTAYKLYINDIPYTFTSDANATDTEIVDGLLALINAGSGDTTTATTPGAPGTETLVLTANAPGNYDAVRVDNPALLSIVQDHADPGLAADLAAIAVENNSWYFILYPYNSKACALVIATYAEANKKMYLPDSVDTNNITLAIGSDTTTSLMGQIKTSARDRTSVWYSQLPSDFLASAVIGRVGPLPPGSETWNLKTLSGPTPAELNATHLTNADAKNGNYYITIGDQNKTQLGKVGSGEYIDTIRFLDWLEARMAEAVFNALSVADKVAFTDGGISVVEGAMLNVLKEGVAAQGLVEGTPKVVAPKASSVSSANKALRRLPDMKFSATLAGAIHTVVIAGNVSV